MSIRNLEYFLNPKSIAVMGATDRPGSVGHVLMTNLVEAGFGGSIYPVNPNRNAVRGLRAYRSVSNLPSVPDFAIIATPPLMVPDIIGRLGDLGTKAVVVITTGFGEGLNSQGLALKQAMLQEAKRNLVRIIGPNCLGIQIPAAKLNASFSGTQALPGNIAFVTQSGAMATAVVDWATSRGIGFSQVISLGDMCDVDFGDMLEFLANDKSTKAILLYIEAVTHPKKFLVAAQSAARMKPVIVVKAGRFAEGAVAATTHTGALAGSDKVYNAVFHRTGLLRVYELEELFEAAETLSKIQIPGGDRLAILTNGGGAGVLATDELVEQGGILASLSPSSIKNLNSILPSTWSHANPIDIVGDAGAERYSRSLDVLLKDEGVDAVLALNCPTAVVDSSQVAESIVKISKGQPKSVLAVWLGGRNQDKARTIFEQAGHPSYPTPEGGVRAFMHLVRYRRSQAALMSSIFSESVDLQTERLKVEQILKEAKDNKWLSAHESKMILAAYGIPVTKSWIARDPDEAFHAAIEAGQPVALKILSPDITHKSDVGGVVLNLHSAEDVRSAGEIMLSTVKKIAPKARIDGFTVEEMVHRPQAFELIVGMNQDLQFGPVILFGEGGKAVEVIDDTALELPPINRNLAHSLIQRTRIFRRLKGFRDNPPVDVDAVAMTIVKVSRLVTDFPEIQGIDINPLISDSQGVLALDARIQLK
ncbi:MAG: acetate--CoA ligase family protein [Bdellovibrionales bacterium]